MNEAAELVIAHIMHTLACCDEPGLARFVRCSQRHVAIAKKHRYYARHWAAQRIIAAWRRFRKFAPYVCVLGPSRGDYETYTKQCSLQHSGLALTSGAAGTLTTDFSRAKTAWLNRHLHHRLRVEFTFLHTANAWTLVHHGDVLRSLEIKCTGVTSSNPIALRLTRIDGLARRIVLRSSYCVWLLNVPVINWWNAFRVEREQSRRPECNVEIVSGLFAFLHGDVREMLLSQTVTF